MAESQNSSENINLLSSIWNYYNGDKKYIEWVSERHEKNGLDQTNDTSNEYVIFLSMNDWFQSKKWFWETYEQYGDQNEFILKLIERYIIDTDEKIIDGFIGSLVVEDDDDW